MAIVISKTNQTVSITIWKKQTNKQKDKNRKNKKENKTPTIQRKTLKKWIIKFWDF